MVRVQTATDRVVNAFERTVAHGPALVDHITLALDKTPAGSYTLALAITDLVTGKKATRVTHFAIRE